LLDRSVQRQGIHLPWDQCLALIIMRGLGKQCAADDSPVVSGILAFWRGH
jgi:hypothetical protein